MSLDSEAKKGPTNSNWRKRGAWDVKLKYNSWAPHNLVLGLERKSCVHEALAKIFKTALSQCPCSFQSHRLPLPSPKRIIFNGLVCSALPFEWNGRYEMIDSSTKADKARRREFTILSTFNYDSAMRKNFMFPKLFVHFFVFLSLCVSFIYRDATSESFDANRQWTALLSFLKILRCRNIF